VATSSGAPNRASSNCRRRLIVSMNASRQTTKDARTLAQGAPFFNACSPGHRPARTRRPLTLSRNFGIIERETKLHRRSARGSPPCHSTLFFSAAPATWPGAN
jgi:hypothetical protein